MSFKNKLSKSVVVLTLTFSSSTQILAEENNYSIKDYQSAVQQEADKYGINISILEYDESKPITNEIIQYGVAAVDNYADSLKVADITTYEIDESEVVPASMIVNRTRTGSFLISNAYGSADMKVSLGVTVDLQNGAVVSVNSKSAYQLGTFVNFQSWQTTSISTTVNSPSTGYVAAVVKGRGTFSYADPYTSITTGYTSSFTKQVNVNCK